MTPRGVSSLLFFLTCCGKDLPSRKGGKHFQRSKRIQEQLELDQMNRQPKQMNSLEESNLACTKVASLLA